ncbi:hypothetical protein [Mesoterricola sediminis]|uniref:Bacteriophage protein n=1 Tax=Mesoterricola sediminis TaxID=2927980 RepID=A0AA48H5E3_9BACT|nr:hypothetical protein [Mesoterricola sediminis]BDU76288.1 bacteriophage protein [Mesoterricola sediminis]
MAAPGSFILTQAARQWLMDGTFDLDLNTFKAALLTSAWTPNMASQSLFADISANEVGTTNTGYTAGGNTLTSVSVSQTGGVGKFTGTIPTWTAGSAGLTARYCAIYAVGTLNGHLNPLLGYFLLDSAPADVVTASGNTLQVNTPVSGFFTLT